ncbi:phospholipase D/nuclease [Rhizopus microsporus var. microsporus]|uniref:phospholipase D n=1 Tax=Rhizopus microsporus var. microsporus TaxID=86635 RepID=A0A1X0QUR2_RHIZD|nr:phospholipase D/nuclease [Rhizopus microsporus var. microsporus]
MTIFSDIAEKVTSLFESSEEPKKEDDDFIEQQLLNEKHRYDSFAAVRHGAQVKYFIDGQNYCWAVSEAIDKATECIYIEDWWLTPELYLRRPPSKYPEYRIDRLLKKKADEGVKIYIVVYKEVEMALTLDSAHTKEALQSLSENIIVMRHPDHSLGGTFFWSHHEKFVVVDNQIAFLGGIDLCFGRWDTHAHPLADFHGNDPESELFPGQDYSDARVRDFDHVKDWDMRLIDKTVIPRMPWHDMSLCVMGAPVLDVARHFCERWNFVKHEKAKDKDNIPFLQPPLGGMGSQQRYIEEDPEAHHYRKYRHNHRTHGVTGTMRTQVLRSSAKWSSGVELEHSIQNAYIATILGAQHYIYIENQFFITATEMNDGSILKNQIGNAIVKRIIRAHEEQEKFKVFVLMPLMPAFPADLSTKDAATARLVMHYQYMSICRGPSSIVEKLKATGIDPDEYIRFYSLRSYDRINRSKLEELLVKAAGYGNTTQQQLDNIEGHEGEEAEVVHHAGDPDFARDTKGSFNVDEEVEYGRIPDDDDIRRHREQLEEGIASDSIAKDAMEGGDIESEPWVNDTKYSQPRDDEAEREEASDYVTEELYIHAKLLIADDKVVIMGSANLNDRSQCGDRDSEIALIVEDKDTIPSKMNGEYYEASRFAATLRRNLWKEHLGLIPDAPPDEVTDAMLPLPTPQIDTTDSEEDRQVMDPLDEDTLSLWNSTAKTNTVAFRHVFHCVPDDTVTTWEEYKTFYPDPSQIDIGHVHDPEMSVDEIRDHLANIHGHLVEFPYHFLENVDLQGESIPFIGDNIQELYT